MVHHLAMRMRDFHALGYVHRDLKPGNVMWLPRENRWTVIDFGCVAKAGELAPICYSLRYTAPEVIQVWCCLACQQTAKVFWSIFIGPPSPLQIHGRCLAR